MKPETICLMVTSLDGRLHPSRWTASPDSALADWHKAYEREHEALDGDAWMVGRVTMAEMSKTGAHPPSQAGAVTRPVFKAPGAAAPYAIALDRGGKLHFAADGKVGGDAVIVLLGRDVPDSHLAELAADGVSYIVAEGAEIDLAAMLDVLGAQFGVKRLLLEGGAGVNGSLLAAGLVDEMRVVVAPALGGSEDEEPFVTYPGGLKGKVQLSLIAAEAQQGGTVLLRYKVTAGA